MIGPASHTIRLNLDNNTTTSILIIILHCTPLYLTEQQGGKSQFFLTNLRGKFCWTWKQVSCGSLDINGNVTCFFLFPFVTSHLTHHTSHITPHTQSSQYYSIVMARVLKGKGVIAYHPDVCYDPTLLEAP